MWLEAIKSLISFSLSLARIDKKICIISVNLKIISIVDTRIDRKSIKDKDFQME